jgi:hypothetical protein
MKSSKTRTMMFLITILTVLAISAIWTLPAFADDVTPPPVPTSEPVVPPEEIPPLEVPPPSDVTIADALAQIPEGTEVVVINTEGENIPLATQEAVDAIVVADPTWCPTGVAPGGAGCSINYGSLQLLVADVGTGLNPTANGVIWISTVLPDASVSPIVINGGTPGAFATWSNFSLTLKGGWTEVGSTINTLDPSELNVSLSIINWNADIALSDILVTGVTGSGTTALNIATSKKVTLTGIHVNGNAGNGANLDNCVWNIDHCNGTSDVVVTASTFNNNANGDGLNVFSGGTITISSVTANGNNAVGGSGATLNNLYATTAKNVVLTSGTLEFNGNGDTGLVVWSKGSITLKDITANTNGTDGAYLDNLGGTAAVTLTGTNVFSENANGGLVVWSKGAIAASNLIANSNHTQWGASLNNAGATTAQPVTLTGTNEFKFNAGGLRILSNGAITLNNITATNTSAYNGVWLVNDTSTVGSNVTLTGANTFNDNYYGGIDVYSKGSIALSNVTANNNGHGALFGFGAFLDNHTAATPKAVTISVSGGNPDSNFNDNFSGGLEIRSLGAISVSGVSANNNSGGNGVTLKNNYPGAVGDTA